MTKNDIDNAAADHSFPISHQFHGGNSTFQNNPMCPEKQKSVQTRYAAAQFWV